MTPREASIGALGEAIEHYSASRFRREDLHLSTFRRLSGAALDPCRLCLYDDAQYSRPSFPFVRFDPDRPYYWAQGRWVESGEAVWVPALATFYESPTNLNDRFCQVTSNGLAAGFDLDDASLRAIFELVERDALMLSWLARRPGRRLHPNGHLELGVSRVLEALNDDGANIELYVLNVGIPMPTVICLGFGDGRSTPAVTLSSAAHISLRIAAQKAILEQGYTRSFLRSAMLGDYTVPDSPGQVRTFLDHALFYAPTARLSAFDFLRVSDWPAYVPSSHDEPVDLSLKACAGLLAAAGIRVAIVDVTAPDVARSPFRVVRALGTDLQPIHCGFGLERLANPRLRAVLSGEHNPDPHPMC